MKEREFWLRSLSRESFECVGSSGVYCATALKSARGAYFRSLTVVALLSRDIREQPLWCAARLCGTNGLIIRGVLRISDEAQRCLCNVECAAIVGRL